MRHARARRISRCHTFCDIATRFVAPYLSATQEHPMDLATIHARLHAILIGADTIGDLITDVEDALSTQQAARLLADMARASCRAHLYTCQAHAAEDTMGGAASVPAPYAPPK